MAEALIWSSVGAWLVCGLLGGLVTLRTYATDPRGQYQTLPLGPALWLIVVLVFPWFGVAGLAAGLRYRHEVRSRLF